MTDEQWRAAWILCERAGDLTLEEQGEYVRTATVDAEVESQVLAVFEELESEPFEPASTPDRRIGDTVGRYILTGRIGQGGMGDVYAAEDTELRRNVALKFLPNTIGADAYAAAHVISEARLASRLHHPNIVTIHELVQTPWGLAIAMELVEGESLRKRLKKQRLSARQAIHIGRQLASALAAAHAQGIVHRDIKPENVMVRNEDFVKVLDFGLAQSVRDRAVASKGMTLPAGTVRYMSPEQKAGEPATAASDIYSLALLLEEAGCPKHALSARMRAPDPKRRVTAQEVERHFASLQTPTHKRLVSAVATLLLLVAIGGVYWLRRARQVAPPHLEKITRYSGGHDVTAAAVSHSGDKLAYATNDGGFFLRDNRAEKLRRLTGPEDFTCHQLLFANDRQLVTVGSRWGRFEAWRVSLEADPPALIADDVQLAALSHSGLEIAWLNGTHQILAGSRLGNPARLLVEVPRGTHVAGLFWSSDDRRVWFQRLSHCREGGDRPDVTIDRNFCDTNDLVSIDPRTGQVGTVIGSLRVISGFFTSSGNFVFLRPDFARDGAEFNIWSLAFDAKTGKAAAAPEQLSHFLKATLSNLTGSADGRTIFLVRTDTSAPIYTAEWQPKPVPSLRRMRRLTFEDSYDYPHTWSADSAAVIFESARDGRSEIFRQKRQEYEPELLASSERDNYYPQLSPDGKWILFMSELRTQDSGYTDLRLMRAPADGGPIAEVPLGEPLDEFRCSMLGVGHICVLRTTQKGEQTYFELDPMSGKRRELARTRLTLSGPIGRWGLSSDGERVAIPDDSGPGRFLDIRLNVDPAQVIQTARQISGINGIIAGMNPGPSPGEWLAWTGPDSRPVQQQTLPPSASDPSQLSALYFVDARRRAHLLQNDSVHSFGGFSPDHRYIAVIRDEPTRNLWRFVH